MIVTAKDTPIAIKSTHQDRPTAKMQLPFRIIGGRYPTIEWDQAVLLPNKTRSNVVMSLPIEDSSFGNQIGLRVKELCEMYHAVENQVDGLLASVDILTTEKVMLEREVEKLQNQLSEALRTKGTNGKK